MPNNLIDLEAIINVMTKETMEKLKLPSLCSTPMILQLDDIPTAKQEGVLEDDVVSVDFWEYMAYIMILQPKANLGGYPLILGRPYLSTVDAHIGCR